MKHSLSRSICISSSCFNIALFKANQTILALCRLSYKHWAKIIASPQGTTPSKGQEGRSHPENQHLPSCVPLVQPGGVADTPGSLTQLQGSGSTKDTLHWLCLPTECCPCAGFQGVPYLHHWVTAQAYSCYCFIIGFIWTLNIHLSINKIIGLARIIKLHLPLVTVWEALCVTPYTSLEKMTFFSLRLSEVSSNNFQYCLDKTQAWFGTLILATGSKHFHTSTLNCIKSMTVPFSPASSRRGN